MVNFPILSLDVGSKRVGVAFMQSFAGRCDFKEVLSRRGNIALDRIIEILTEKEVKTVVAGLPLNSRGERTEQTEDIERFCRRIERRVPIEIEYCDEFLTSVEAKEIAPSGAKAIDDHAAEIIMKRYLAAHGLLKELR